MIQAQLKRMQGLPWQLHRQFAAAAVGGIPTTGWFTWAQCTGSDGATGIETQQRVITEPFLQRPMGAGVTAQSSLTTAYFAIRGMAADGTHDRAAVTTRYAVHPPDIPVKRSASGSARSRTSASWDLAITMQPVVSLSSR